VSVQSKKLVACVLAIMIFAAILLVTYVGHANYLAVDVVFYSALQDVVVALVLSAIIISVAPTFNVLERTERVLLCSVFALGGYAFAISIPTVVDRSLSLYLLEKLDQRGGGIRQAALEGVIVNEFMREYRVLDARLTEQLESGTIVITNGCVQLTAKGKLIAASTAAFRANFLPKQRQLMGVYSADLTTPLRHSDMQIDYRCP